MHPLKAAWLFSGKVLLFFLKIGPVFMNTIVLKILLLFEILLEWRGSSTKTDLNNHQNAQQSKNVNPLQNSYHYQPVRCHAECLQIVYKKICKARNVFRMPAKRSGKKYLQTIIRKSAYFLQSAWHNSETQLSRLLQSRRSSTAAIIMYRAVAAALLQHRLKKHPSKLL